MEQTNKLYIIKKMETVHEMTDKVLDTMRCMDEDMEAIRSGIIDAEYEIISDIATLHSGVKVLLTRLTDVETEQ